MYAITIQSLPGRYSFLPFFLQVFIGDDGVQINGLRFTAKTLSLTCAPAWPRLHAAMPSVDPHLRRTPTARLARPQRHRGDGKVSVDETRLSVPPHIRQRPLVAFPHSAEAVGVRRPALPGYLLKNRCLRAASHAARRARRSARYATVLFLSISDRVCVLAGKSENCTPRWPT